VEADLHDPQPAEVLANYLQWLSQSANAHVIWSADYSRNSLFGWFVAGLVAYALLLIFATVAGKPGAA
jgi:hypothetical protein